MTDDFNKLMEIRRYSFSSSLEKMGRCRCLKEERGECERKNAVVPPLPVLRTPLSMKNGEGPSNWGTLFKLKIISMKKIVFNLALLMLSAVALNAQNYKIVNKFPVEGE